MSPPTEARIGTRRDAERAHASGPVRVAWNVFGPREATLGGKAPSPRHTKSIISEPPALLPALALVFEVTALASPSGLSPP